MIISDFLAKIGFKVDDQGLDNTKQKIEGLHRNLSLLVSGVVLQKLYHLAESFGSVGDSLRKASIASGVSVEQMQKLQFAASQSGVSTQQLSTYMMVLNRQLYAAKNGSKQAVELFESIGISKSQLDSVDGAGEALYLVQDAINSTAQNAGQRLGLITKFFGRGGGEIGKFVAAGSKATRSLEDEFERMGAVVGGAGISALEEADDAIGGLKMVLRAFAMLLGSEIAPAIVNAVHSIEDGWKKNAASIKENMKVFVDSVLFYAGMVYEAIRLVVVSVANFVREHPKMTEWGLKFYIGAAIVSTALSMILGIFSQYEKGKKVFTGALAVCRTGLTLFKDGLALAAQGLGRFLEFFSPGSGKALIDFGVKLRALALNPFMLQMAGWAALIAAIVLSVQALYAVLFQGKDFGETWLGKILSFGLDAGKAALKTVGSFLGIGSGPETEPSVATGTGGAASMVDRMQAQTSGLAALGDMFSGTADMGLPAGPAAPIGQLVTGQAGQPVVNVDAKITVPPGFNEKQTVTVIREGMAGAMQDAMRVAHRSFAPAAMR